MPAGRVIRVVDEGYDFAVAIVDEEWVFRFPRRAEAADWLATEIAALPALARALPVAVPQLEVVSDAPRFVAYRLIEGRPLEREDPEGVRAFLDALHAVVGLDVPRPDWVALYRAHCDEFARDVLPLLDVDLRDDARALFADIDSLAGFAPAVVHCDLGPAHLLVRDGRLAGVIDWSHVSYGDPAVDYAWLLGVPFPDWDVDDELRSRARWYHRLGPWFEVRHGLRFGIDAYVRDGLAGVVARL